MSLAMEVTVHCEPARQAVFCGARFLSGQLTGFSNAYGGYCPYLLRPACAAAGKSSSWPKVGLPPVTDFHLSHFLVEQRSGL